MVLMDWVVAIITTGLAYALYVYLDFHPPDVSWGSALDAQKYKTALQSLSELDQTQDHVKNYRPHVLCMSGDGESYRPGLHAFAGHLKKGRGLNFFGSIIPLKIDDFMATAKLEELKDLTSKLSYEAEVDRPQVPYYLGLLGLFDTICHTS